MRSISYIIGVMIVCLLSACGQRHTAISLANDFVEANAADARLMQDRQFGKLGITNRLNDSVVDALQQRPNPFYRQDVDYPNYQQGDTLYFVRMSFTHQGDTLSHTFYLDQQLKHVVAVK